MNIKIIVIKPNPLTMKNTMIPLNNIKHIFIPENKVKDNILQMKLVIYKKITLNYQVKFIILEKINNLLNIFYIKNITINYKRV